MIEPRKRGAPRKAADLKRVQVHVTLPPRVADAIHALAERMGYATSKYCELLVRYAIERDEAGEPICAPGDRPRPAGPA